MLANEKNNDKNSILNRLCPLVTEYQKEGEHDEEML